jgi:hypothetical protein
VPSGIEFAEKIPEGVRPDTIPASEWVLIETTPGESVLAVIPHHMRDAVAAEIAKRPPNELLRPIETSALPHATVKLPHQPGAAVRILGKSRMVVASGVASTTRVRWAIVALVVIALLAAVAVAVSQASS